MALELWSAARALARDPRDLLSDPQGLGVALTVPRADRAARERKLMDVFADARPEAMGLDTILRVLTLIYVDGSGG